MHVLVCIDDTDSLECKGFKGTGDLAQKISMAIEEYGWGKCKRVTRHQLLLHEDIPYTSHNSSMCFEADIDENHLNSVINFGSKFLSTESEPSADPGLCVAVIDQLTDPEALIQFGYMAKQVVLKKEDAYSLAQRLGIHLSEHGGTGQGVIGALAGAGLRLGGNDGWFKDKISIENPGECMTVSQLCKFSGAEYIKNLDGIILDESEIVMLGKMVKLTLSKGKAVVLVEPSKDKEIPVSWKTCSREQLHKLQEKNTCTEE